MVISERLKQLIFKRLYEELGNVEIIPYKDSIWFINREKEFWYFELDKSGTLWWRYDFFNSFFQIFSMSSEDFCPILSSWVEEVLNHKVSTTTSISDSPPFLVEEVLNHKVCATGSGRIFMYNEVEEVLNHKVCATDVEMSVMDYVMEQVINHTVSTTEGIIGSKIRLVDEVLNQ